MRGAATFLVAAGLLAACGGGSGVSTVSPAGTDAGSATVVTAPDGSSGTVPGGPATTEATAPALAIDEQGFEAVPLSWGGYGVMAAAEATNTTGRYIQSMQYTTAYLDAAGTVLYEGSGITLGVPPGGIAVMQGGTSFDEGTAPVATVEFTLDAPVLSDGLAFEYATTGPIDLRQISVTVDPGRITTAYSEQPEAFAVLHNTGAGRIQNLPYQCVWRRGGAIVLATAGSAAELLPGGTAGAWSHPRFDGVAPPDDVRCTANPSEQTRLTAPDDRGVEITGSGFTTAARSYTGGYDTLGAVLLHNPGTMVLEGVRVQMDLYDASGALIRVGDVFDGYVLPGEEAVYAPILVAGRGEAPAATAVVGVSVDNEQPADAVSGVVGSDPFDLTQWVFTTTGAHYEFRDVTAGFVGDVVNPRPVTVTGGVEVSCAMLQGGVVVGGAQFTGPEPIPASGSATFEVITTPFGSNPTHDEVRCTAHVNALFETEP